MSVYGPNINSPFASRAAQIREQPRYAAALAVSERAKLLSLCGHINPLTMKVCTMPLDHDENHAAHKLNAHGDPSGPAYATWAKLVAL